MPRKSSRSLWADKISGKSTTSSTQIPHKLNNKSISGTILGIDPSLRGTGLALIHYSPNRKLSLIQSTTVKLGPSASNADCLAAIHNTVNDFLNIQSVQYVALEQPIYVQNVKSAHAIGAARGAAITAAALSGISVHEYPPLRVKQAVVGYGRASKDQVAKTVQQHLGHKESLPYDESDAVAIALCHALTHRE